MGPFLFWCTCDVRTKVAAVPFLFESAFVVPFLFHSTKRRDFNPLVLVKKKLCGPRVRRARSRGRRERLGAADPGDERARNRPDPSMSTMRAWPGRRGLVWRPAGRPPRLCQRETQRDRRSSYRQSNSGLKEINASYIGWRRCTCERDLFDRDQRAGAVARRPPAASESRRGRWSGLATTPPKPGPSSAALAPATGPALARRAAQRATSGKTTCTAGSVRMRDSPP